VVSLDAALVQPFGPDVAVDREETECAEERLVVTPPRVQAALLGRAHPIPCAMMQG
jgi:hypothetical protein